MDDMNEPATKKDLNNLGEIIRADINDLARHFNTAQGKLETKVDNLATRMDDRFSEVDKQILEVNTKLDAIMSGEILVTRKQIQRLITALETQGMKFNVSEILAA